LHRYSPHPLIIVADALRALRSLNSRPLHQLQLRSRNWRVRQSFCNHGGQGMAHRSVLAIAAVALIGFSSRQLTAQLPPAAAPVNNAGPPAWRPTSAAAVPIGAVPVGAAPAAAAIPAQPAGPRTPIAK